MSPPPKHRATQQVDAFITRWTACEGGAEFANYQIFLAELCTLIGVGRPDPAGSDTELSDYVFERQVKLKGSGGQTSGGHIDLYKKGAFVLEVKQSRQKGGKKYIAGAPCAEQDRKRGRRTADRRWDVLMLNARRQAEDYAKALPPEHGRPPFLLVCDVGHCIEVFADFTGQGTNYAQFPDRQGFRIFLEDLHNADVRQRLACIWTDPHTLDPARKTAKVTREIAVRLAELMKSLERSKFPAEDSVLFLMRCLFTMFAEDVELLPENAFTGLLAECEKDPAALQPMLGELWNAMDKGGSSNSIHSNVKIFNGNLFANAKVVPLDSEAIRQLKDAAGRDWREVEPAIFGSLLEQALDPIERQRLGAHYTPRAYVERLVVATIMEPLRADWAQVLTTAERLKSEDESEAAAKVVRKFYETLCATRVLDPACGTGNFLYVSLELMKRLEGEVIEALLDLGGQEALVGPGGHSIDPHQFLGLELNPRAAAIAELVLWLGYLQWHLRTKAGMPAEPSLRSFENINFGKAGQGYDAVLAHDGFDEQRGYTNPHRPQWPQAEYIVGNPPFIGGKDIRSRLGEAYAGALWKAHAHINESADFAMYWWDRAAEILTAKGTQLRRFGLVTTNSITQEFSRRVIKSRMEKKTPLSLVMAVADHPWMKVTSDAAAVRIAMTVAAKGKMPGLLREVATEHALDTDTPVVSFLEHRGTINADLSVGTDLTRLIALRANELICSRGVALHGAGFIVTRGLAQHLGLGKRVGLEKHILDYIHGRDIVQKSRELMVIDLDGLESADVRAQFPEVYQHLLQTLKPERDGNNEEYRRTNWWLFGRRNTFYRAFKQGLPRYIVTPETAKHRIFTFIEGKVLADNMVVNIGSDDAYLLGVLSSRTHVVWALRAGGWLGVGNDPRYSKSRVFDPFPFPEADERLKAQIRSVAQELDASRKARQVEHPGLTLTQMYNVREAIREGRKLDDGEEIIKDQALVLILNELHDKLDALVFRAYGWPATSSDQEILTRLVALHVARVADERKGVVRWLRPDYQKSRVGVARAGPDQTQAALSRLGQTVSTDGGTTFRLRHKILP